MDAYIQHRNAVAPTLYLDYVRQNEPAYRTLAEQVGRTWSLYDANMLKMSRAERCRFVMSLESERRKVNAQQNAQRITAQDVFQTCEEPFKFVYCDRQNTRLTDAYGEFAANRAFGAKAFLYTEANLGAKSMTPSYCPNERL